MEVIKNITNAVGKTPLLSLLSYQKSLGLTSNLLAKFERFNPAGSVKDRIALRMILDAEQQGLLSAQSVIIEATSGNTGIGLASVARALGYRIVLTMPESMTVERRHLLLAYGAELVLTDGKLGMKGAIAKAEELAQEIENSFIPRQFDNPANPKAHEETTAPELWEATNGNIDVFVAGVGTGGTITGVGRFLKRKNPAVKIIAVEPEKSPVLSGGVAGPHGIQGIGAGFIPSLLDLSLLDEIHTITEEESYLAARLVRDSEGILIGISSGAALAVATKLARLPVFAGKNIVVVFPDGGERYLSTPLFGSL